jgi:nitroreductase
MRALLHNEDKGLGLSVADDKETTEALSRAVEIFLARPLEGLRSQTLDASFFNELLNPDHVRSLLDYLNDPAGFAALVGAAQSAATSSNLQLWSIVSVQDPETRSELAEVTENPQVKTAAWFFAFLADHHRLRASAAKGNEACEALEHAEFYTMAVIDAALAAERLVCAAESIGIGICYIGGLRNDPERIRELLDLPDGVFGVFGLCLGWPASDVDAEIKPRLRPEAIWFREKYSRTPDVQEYDVRMVKFYSDHGMKGNATWSVRSGRRTDPKHLRRRATQLQWLRDRGFLKQ